MHTLLAALLIQTAVAPPRVLESQFDEWAKSRDVAALEANSPDLKGQFQFLKSNGAFGVGRFGWNAVELRDPVGSGHYIVFTTPLTTQDYGDQVFRYDGQKLTQRIDESDSRGMRLPHADMSLRFEPSSKKAFIDCLASFEKGTGSEPSFFVRLSNNYRISSVSDEAGKAVKFAQAGGVVALPTPSNAHAKYRLKYEAIVDRPRFAGAIVADEVMLTEDYWWPSIARQPLSVRTKTTVPSDWTVIAQGNRIDKEDTSGGVTWTYEMDLPVSYLSLSAGKFKYAERSVGAITYFVASRELSDEQMQDQLQLIPPVIEYFSTLRPHPFKVYGAVDTALYSGGALEAYSYATYGHGWLPDEDPHEPSHTWWGGIIPNTYLKSFWNESFASFSEGLYAREGAIGNVAEKRIAFIKPAQVNAAFDRDSCGTAGVDAGGIASALGYGKGALVLQQLELEMGHDTFISVLKKWLTEHKSGTAGDWAEFQAACGTEWQWFFDQWIWRPGWPKVTAQQKWAASESVIEIKQTGRPFWFKLQVAVRHNGTWFILTKDVVPNSEGIATISVPASVGDLITLDPWDRILNGQRPRLPHRADRRRLVVDASASIWTEGKAAAVPENLDSVMLYADPQKSEIAAQLCQKAGFAVSGNILTYEGKSYDLMHHGAVAVVEYEPGKWAGIRLGRTRRNPDIGNASIAITDEYGRFLTGKSIPRDRGEYTFEVQ